MIHLNALVNAEINRNNNIFLIINVSLDIPNIFTVFLFTKSCLTILDLDSDIIFWLYKVKGVVFSIASRDI